jgi:hypothetical protein
MTRRIAAALVVLGLLAAACDPSSVVVETTTTGVPTTTTTPPSSTTTWPSEVRVSIDDDLAALVVAAPEGTTFILDGGVHHVGVLEPKDGMTFSGSSETVLSGATPLDAFDANGTRWELTGQPLAEDERCLPGEEACGIRNELFIDDQRLTRVESVTELEPGAWWGDGDRIVIADDPADHTVELSVGSHAFAGDATDVTVAGLVVEKFAVPARDGAIQSQALDDGPLGTNWVIEDVEVRNNHAAGIRVGRGTVVRNVLAHSNGPVAVTGNSNSDRLIEGVVIEELTVSNEAGDCVSVIHGRNVTVRSSTIGPCSGEALYLSEVAGADVSGNTVTGTGVGVLVHLSDSIAVDDNTFENPGRNFVQFDKVNGPGSSISMNRGQSDLGASDVEDMISLFESNGTPESPIRVVGNQLRDGGPSQSGSGILLGDGGGSYQIADDNRLVNTGQVGIGVASGTEITVSNNKVYSEAQPWSNVGIYVWNQYPTECSTINVSGNQVNWTSAAGRENHWFNGGGCRSVNAFDNEWGAEIGAGIF